ncbi:MAG: D-2-hydroxyacid dehydrogenase [Candidatus Dormibacteraceae bacterium]
MKLLLVLAFPEAVRNQYRDGLAAAFPELEIEMVDHHSRVDPYIEDAEILVTFGAHINDRVLERASHLRWIQALGTGVDGIVDRPALREGVIVTNLRGLHGKSVSEAALAFMLALARNLPRAVRSQSAGQWDRFQVTILAGATVGILGVGVIAEELAPRCKALGMKVVGITSAKRHLSGFDEMRGKDDLLSAVRDLDYLVVLTPYTRESHHIIDARVLAAMKRSAYLVNLARGGVVDEQALIDALRSNVIAGAALDVFAEEPLPPGHPFYSMQTVIITPHMAGFHVGYAKDALPIVEENIRRFIANDFDHMLNVVRR